MRFFENALFCLQFENLKNLFKKTLKKPLLLFETSKFSQIRVNPTYIFSDAAPTTNRFRRINFSSKLGWKNFF
jgi:hypothetical protein